MSFKETFVIPYEDTDQNSQLKSVALLQYLQKIAMKHSHSLGYTSTFLHQEQIGWMLHQLQFNCQRLPQFEDEITIHTWSHSIVGFKGLRRFEIYLKDEKVLVADTLWLFLDMKRRRVKRVPERIIEDYKELPPIDMESSIDLWRPAKAERYDYSVGITVRRSDIDTNQHVNNAIYADMLETAIYQASNCFTGFRQFSIQFQKEIPKDVLGVKVGLFTLSGKHYFDIYSPDTVYASGEYDLF